MAGGLCHELPTNSFLFNFFLFTVMLVKTQLLPWHTILAQRRKVPFKCNMSARKQLRQIYLKSCYMKQYISFSSRNKEWRGGQPIQST